jgi:hypothetical protein
LPPRAYLLAESAWSALSACGVKGDIACVNIRRTSSTEQLTSEQLNMLVQIVIDESGYTLTRVEFNDTMLMLFENIAGFETLSTKQSTRFLNTLWSMYRHCRNTEPGL